MNRRDRQRIERVSGTKTTRTDRERRIQNSAGFDGFCSASPLFGLDKLDRTGYQGWPLSGDTQAVLGCVVPRFAEQPILNQSLPASAGEP